MKKKFLSMLLAVCMILPCIFALSACGDGDEKRYIQDSAEKAEVRTYFNNVFAPLVDDEVQKTLTYTLTYEVSLTQKLLDSNNEEADFETIIGRPPENQAYSRKIEAGYNDATKNFYKRLLGVHSQTGAQINEPLEFIQRDGTNTVYYNFDQDYAYKVSPNHADLIDANKSISGFTYFAKSFESFLVNDNANFNQYSTAENNSKFREKFDDFSEVDPWLDYLEWGDTDLRTEFVYKQGDSYYTRANISASYPYKDIDGWALVEFTKEECKGFKAEFSISSSDEVEHEGQTYTGFTEFKIKINEVVEFDKYDSTKEITETEKSHFVSTIDTVRTVQFHFEGIYEEMEFYVPYSSSLELPDFIANAYEGKQHFQIKAYTDAEKTKELALDGSTKVTSASGVMNVYLDVIVDDGFAVILENICTIDESNDNATERKAFEFKVIDLSQTTEYPSGNNIATTYGETGGFSFSLGGDVDNGGDKDFLNNPIQLQSGNFIVLSISFFK
ncbi:MAG: hypothetical protein IJX98_01375 [Clostridia bacterium]|nr:hypothetical protein [Clostridia bacterium]